MTEGFLLVSDQNPRKFSLKIKIPDSQKFSVQNLKRTSFSFSDELRHKDFFQNPRSKPLKILGEFRSKSHPEKIVCNIIKINGFRSESFKIKKSKHQGMPFVIPGRLFLKSHKNSVRRSRRIPFGMPQRFRSKSQFFFQNQNIPCGMLEGITEGFSLQSNEYTLQNRRRI